MGHTDMLCGINGLANVITDKYDLDLDRLQLIRQFF